MKKTVSAFICALLVCTLLFTGIIYIGDVQVQAASKKPAIPEFTVKYAEYPFTMPDVEYVDPYTGETWINKGYQGVMPTLELVIKNPRGYSDICYNVRYKGHYETSDTGEAWHEVFPHSEIGGGLDGGFPAQSGLEYTTILFNSSIYPSCISNGYVGTRQYPSVPVPGGTIDIQVEAMVFTLKEDWNPILGFSNFYIVDERSGWSSTKTLTRPTSNNEVPNQNKPTPNPTYASDQPPQTDQSSQPEMSIAGFSLLEFSLVIILCTTLPVLIVALIYTRKTARHKQTTQT